MNAQEFCDGPRLKVPENVGLVYRWSFPCFIFTLMVRAWFIFEMHVLN